MTIVSIDPGATGALAFLSPGGHLLRVVDMPVCVVGKRTRVAPQALALLLAAQPIQHAYLELVGAMPGQGTVSMFAFGQAFGTLEGVLAALGVPVTYVDAAGLEEGHAGQRRQGIVPPPRDAALSKACCRLHPRQRRWPRRSRVDRRLWAAPLSRCGNTMTTGNPWSGHLKRCTDGQYRGVLTDGVRLPIHITAEVQEDPGGGRSFILDGVRGKKPPPPDDQPPWNDPS